MLDPILGVIVAVIITALGWVWGYFSGKGRAYTNTRLCKSCNQFRECPNCGEVAEPWEA